MSEPTVMWHTTALGLAAGIAGGVLVGAGVAKLGQGVGTRVARVRAYGLCRMRWR